MARLRVAGLGLGALMCVLVPMPAAAQQSSGIAGMVRDTSGAVLPGVTVEAASPVLIERVRSVVTDGEGRYSIVNLGPGTYAVTFSLPGFTTVRRESVALSAGFTATVNGDLAVGSVTETITVSGASPLVDTTNVRRQTVVSKDLLDVLPTGTQSVATLITLIPGLNGTGSAGPIGEVGGQRSDFGTYHGKLGTKAQFDGVGTQNAVGTGSTGYLVNPLTVEEMTVQTSGISAESSADGAVVNAVPKEGGNLFRGSVIGTFSNHSMQSSNLTDDLVTRGLTSVNQTMKVYDSGFSLGGPIKKDKLWFFFAFRHWGNENVDAGTYWNKTQGTPLYTPDLDRPADRYQWYESRASRVTWQATSRNKFNVYADPQDDCICRSTSQIGNDPVAALAYHQRPQGLYHASWTSLLTGRLIVEAAAAEMLSDWPNIYAEGVEPDDVSILEQSTNFRYGSRASYLGPVNQNRRKTVRASMSYVTGSHAIKVGFQDESLIRNAETSVNGNVNYTFNNQKPSTITQYATPYLEQERIKADLGMYIQDQWTFRRLTLNFGVRLDYLNGYVPAQSLEATPNGWVPARSFDKVTCVPCWWDVDPRLGVAYDIFGTGRTAVKVSLGRYVNKTAVETPTLNNPINASVNMVTRTWTDTDNDFIPDCDLGNPLANNECLAMNNQSFGGLNVTTRFADDVNQGWGVRPYNWDLSAEVQHQLTPQVSMNVGYYRNWFGNFTVTDNLTVTPDDYTSYCVPAPTNARLPGGGGYQVCGLYDVAPAKFSGANNLVMRTSDQTQVNDFISVTLNTRFARGARLGGGLDTGRSVSDACFVVDTPQQLLNCHTVTPFSGQTQIKMNGSIPLPWDLVVSGVLLNMSGPAITATFNAPTTLVAQSLGRNLAACGTRNPCTSTSPVPLIEPGVQFEKRISRLDLRLTKLVRLGTRMRLQANVDAYNALNSSDVVLLNVTYGSQWLRPNSVLEGRLLQVSGNLTF